MVDDVRAEIPETTESKEALDRARLARERREAEQRRRLDELRAHAAAAQAQREKRDEERRRRQAEQRAKDDDRRQQVEERKRAIWEASVSRREALLQRERERTERLERARASRSSPRPAFAFGSSTPRLLEPLDSSGFFWAARSTNPIDQMNFFESLAASTTNVMFASAPLTRRASALHLDSEADNNKDEPERSPQPIMWSSVARRRTDLVPTLPAPRAPGRAYSMTRLDKIPTQRPLHSTSPSMHHLNRTQPRSGETTPGSRPGSAMSSASVVRRPASAPRKPRPASIAGTGVNTPRGVLAGGGDTGAQSVATTPSVSRDGTVMACGDVPRRAQSTPRRPRPASMHVPKQAAPTNPADGKPPLHRKPKPSKDHDKLTPRGKSLSASPGRTLSPSPSPASKEPSVDKEVSKPIVKPDKNQVSAIEVTQKLEALQIQNGDTQSDAQNQNNKINENKESADEAKTKSKPVVENKPVEVQKPVEEQKPVEKKEEKKESSQERAEESEMTASMTAKRITTEEEAKAALAERRRKAREELEKQAELERQRLQREAEEEAERQRQEEERQRREEEEARELAQLQRNMEEEKLRKAIEAQQQLERDEAERKAREEVERQARLKEDEEKRRAAEEAERLRREEAEREEKERIARKQRVEAIMARTRLRKAEEDKKQQEIKGQAGAAPAASPAPAAAAPAPADNGNGVATGDLLGFATSQSEENNVQKESTPQTNQTTPAPAPETAAPAAATATPNNGNVTADLLGLSEQNSIEDKPTAQMTGPANKQPTVDNLPNANVSTSETNNGNFQHSLVEPTTNVGHISANFIQTERMSNEHSQSKLPENVPKLIEDDFTAHNGHGTAHNHPLTLQNAI